MNVVGVAVWGARLLLAATFLTACAGKAMDLKGSREAVRGFGVPGRLADVLGTLLPFGEGLLGIGLLVTAAAWWGSVGALLLLAAFVVAISANLLRGRRPQCHCFGVLHSAPAGPGTLARNAALMAMAGWLVARGAGGMHVVVGWTRVGTLVTAAGLGAVVLGAGVVWFLLQVFQQNGRLLARVEALERVAGVTGVASAEALPAPRPKAGLTPGVAAPRFALVDASGMPRSLDAELQGGLPVLLAFIDPGCGPCMAMLADFAQWYRDFKRTVRIVLASRGEAKANLEKVKGFDLPVPLLQMDREVADAFQCYGTPGAVWVNADGSVGSYVAQGADEIRQMFEEQRKKPKAALAAAAVTLQVGDRAPEFALRSISGREVRMADYAGKRTALLFWNPGCGFCQNMLSELRQWEKDPTEGLELLVVSTGAVAENEAMGLGSEVVLDDAFWLGRTLGAPGTPSAVIVNPGGEVASTVRVGPAVWELLRVPVGVEGLAG